MRTQSARALSQPVPNSAIIIVAGAMIRLSESLRLCVENHRTDKHAPLRPGIAVP